MRRAGLCIAWLVAACRFDGGGVPLDGSEPVDAASDGPIDGALDAPVPVDAAPDGSPDAASCPSSYVDLADGGTRYRIATNTATWQEAEEDCEDDSPTSHLVVIETAAEIADLAMSINGRVWIGASDRVTENSFLQVTGGLLNRAFFQNNEPNNGGFLGGPENCVELIGNQLNDEACEERQGYICECDALAARPETYTPRP